MEGNAIIVLIQYVCHFHWDWFSLDIIPCGWLGSKHKLTNNCDKLTLSVLLMILIICSKQSMIIISEGSFLSAGIIFSSDWRHVH